MKVLLGLEKSQSLNTVLPFSFKSFERFVPSYVRSMCFHSFSFFLRLLVLLLGLLVTNLTSILYEPLNPDLVNSAKLDMCASETLKNFTSRGRIECAAACAHDPACGALLFTEPNQCALLSTPWRSAATTSLQSLMMRREAHPSKRAWLYGGSQYVLTNHTGFYNDIKTTCAAKGMHLWHPNSKAEMQFVEREIFCNLPKESFWFVGFDNGEEVVTFNIWLGVIDSPNGNCLLSDGVTKCPVENYYPGQPNSEYQECTKYWWRNGLTAWDDSNCQRLRHGLCEKEVV